MNTYQPGTDIDLTLVGKRLSRSTLLHIAEAMDDAPIPYVVDLSIFDDIRDDQVREHILRQGKVFYQSYGGA